MPILLWGQEGHNLLKRPDLKKADKNSLLRIMIIFAAAAAKILGLPKSPKNEGPPYFRKSR